MYNNSNDLYNKTRSCAICGKLFLSYNSSQSCCDVCQKNIIDPFKDKITEYRINNPGANVMDIVNSGLIVAPDGVRLSLSEFRKIVFQSYSDNGQLIDDSVSQKHFSNALLRDLDALNDGKLIRKKI